MTRFKQAFIESLLTEAEMPTGYKNPTPKATFQLNDIVLVRSQGDDLEEMKDYFEGLQPKKYYRYFNNVGKVIGYKAGTMSAKFAVEFSDGTIGSFNTAHLRGPFVSVKAAETAAKQTNNNFAPELSSKFVPRDELIPTNKPLEDYFKELFVTQSMGFTWLDTPVVINTRAVSNEQLVVLAHKPRSVKPDEDELRYREWEKQLPEELNSSFLFFKVFNTVTGKFKQTTDFDQNLWTVRMPLSNPRSGYYMQLPTFSNSNYAIRLASEEQNYQSSLCVSTMPVNKSFEKHLKLCVSNFEKAEKLPTLTSFEEYFDTILYNVVERDGVKTIIATPEVRIDIDLQDMPAKFDLSKYKIEGNCYLETKKKFFSFPKEVTNNFRLMGNEMKLKNLIGLPKIGGQCILTLGSLDSLEGCPLEINSDFKLELRQGNLSNLKFLPKRIKGYCDISTEVKSFEGGDDCIIDGTLLVTKSCKDLEGLPKAGDYVIGVHQKEIDDYFKFKGLKQKLPELEGIF